MSEQEIEGRIDKIIVMLDLLKAHIDYLPSSEKETMIARVIRSFDLKSKVKVARGGL